MRKKCLIVVSEFPFPARNGVTIPTSNYIKILKAKDYIIDLVVLAPNDIEKMSANRCIRHMINVKTYRNTLLSYFKEITIQEAFFNSYEYDSNLVYKFIESNGPYDLIVCSPINVTKATQEFIDIHKQLFNLTPFAIAAISDCYTTVLGNPIVSETFKINILMKNLVKKIRSRLMKTLEYKSLKHFDRIFVQTELDAKQLSLVSKNKLNKKIKIFTNGVDESLFEINNKYNKNFVFVASLKVLHYKNILLWLYKNVWKSISKVCTECKLYIYTGGSIPETIFNEMLQDKSVIFIDEFVENIDDIYMNKSFCFAPIFKDHGFINKVAEAMSAGLVVIGDKSAFNGIIGYQHDDNVIVSNNSEEFIGEALKVLQDEKHWERLSTQAKKLSSLQFSWSSKGVLFD